MYLTYQEAQAIYEAALAHFNRLSDGDCSLEEYAKATKKMVDAYDDLRGLQTPRPPYASRTKRNTNAPF